MMRAVIGQKRVEVVEKITESGTWSVPAGCRSVEVWVIGGGGGGGKTGHAGGGGGGGGQVVHGTVSVRPGDSIKVVIGLGGYAAKYGSSGYSYIDGTNGEDSSFGDIVAHGGDFGKSAHSAFSAYGGAGGDNYTKGGNGASVPRYDNQSMTSGVNGVLIDGEYYGSSGGAGNFYMDYNGGAGSKGGVNAGNGKTLYEWDRDESGNVLLGDSKAPDSFGGGGGASCPEYRQPAERSGGSGAVILKYLK